MIRLCFLSSNYSIGGLEKMIYALSKELNRNVFDLTICFLRKSGRFQDWIERNLSGEIQICKLAGSTLPATARMLSFVRAQKFDVIHAFGFRSDVFCRILSDGNLHTKFCSTIPNPDLPNSLLKKMTARWISQNVRVYWADCHYRQDVGVTRLHIPRQKISVIYPGVSSEWVSDSFDPALVKKQLGIPLDSLIVCSLGNLRSIKGHPFIVEAAHLILKEFPETVFVMIGEDWMHSKLEQMARSLDIHEQFRFAGFLEDPLPVLQASDILLQPSISEGLPRAILEAMSAGKPVIASNVGGIPEVIEHGLNGILIPAGDVRSLADETKKLLRNPDARSKLGNVAQDTIQKKFLLKDMVQNFEMLYQQLHSESPAFA